MQNVLLSAGRNSQSMQVAVGEKSEARKLCLREKCFLSRGTPCSCDLQPHIMLCTTNDKSHFKNDGIGLLIKLCFSYKLTFNSATSSKLSHFNHAVQCKVLLISLSTVVRYGIKEFVNC